MPGMTKTAAIQPPDVESVSKSSPSAVQIHTHPTCLLTVLPAPAPTSNVKAKITHVSKRSLPFRQRGKRHQRSPKPLFSVCPLSLIPYPGTEREGGFLERRYQPPGFPGCCWGRSENKRPLRGLLKAAKAEGMESRALQSLVLGGGPASKVQLTPQTNVWDIHVAPLSPQRDKGQFRLRDPTAFLPKLEF